MQSPPLSIRHEINQKRIHHYWQTKLRSARNYQDNDSIDFSYVWKIKSIEALDGIIEGGLNSPVWSTQCTDSAVVSWQFTKHHFHSCTFTRTHNKAQINYDLWVASWIAAFRLVLRMNDTKDEIAWIQRFLLCFRFRRGVPLRLFETIWKLVKIATHLSNHILINSKMMVYLIYTDQIRYLWVLYCALALNNNKPFTDLLEWPFDSY